MDIVSTLFMAIVGITVLISTFIVVREVIKENGANKRARIDADREIHAAVLAKMEEERLKLAAAANAEPPAIQAPAAPALLPAAEPAPAQESVAEADTDGTVKFAVSQRQTLEEQYEALSEEQKGFYDTIAKYAAAKEGSKCNKNKSYEEYKFGSKRIVRMRIKRGMLQCEFLMINRDLRNQIGDNKNSVKEAATIIKVQNENMLPVVFGSIDLALQLIEEERAYKKQLAKERRKQARLSQQQQ